MNQPSRTRQPSTLAIQVCHVWHLLQMINPAARLVMADLDFCTSWGRTQWFLLFKRCDLRMSPLHCVINCSEKVFTLILSGTSQIVENAPSRNVEESLKSLDPDPEANDFQNLISSSLSTNPVICGTIFMCFLRKVANRQKTDKRLLGGGKKHV